MKTAWISCAALAFLVASPTADARKKRKPRATAAQKKELGSLMGEFSFGQTKKQVLAKLAKDIRERYQDKISATNDVYKQDKLRKDRDAEINRIKKSFLEFKGTRSGWDVSIVDDQFAHHTDESMMVYWKNEGGKNERHFFFFHEGKLYKRFIALDSSVLKKNQRSFAYLQVIMEKRFGAGNVKYRTDKQGVEYPDYIAWESRKHLVRAYDKLSFYGSFCLSVADPSVEKKVLAKRAKNKKPPKPDAVIDAVVQKEGSKDRPTLDENSSAVDSIVGSD